MTKHSGSQIRRVRKSKGWTIKDLAHSCGISTMYLCDIELGRRRGSPRVLAALAERTGVQLPPPKVIARIEPMTQQPTEGRQ